MAGRENLSKPEQSSSEMKQPLENIIDPDRIEHKIPIRESFQETNPQLENIVDLSRDNVSSLLLNQIINYQKNISPRIKEVLQVERLCKYNPSCSEYAKQSIEKYGALRGTILASGRLLRCNHWSKGGDDPVT